MTARKQRVSKDGFLPTVHPGGDRAFQPFPSCKLSFIVRLRHFQCFFETRTSLFFFARHHLCLAINAFMTTLACGAKSDEKPSNTLPMNLRSPTGSVTPITPRACGGMF